jgi:hypothetical protein
MSQSFSILTLEELATWLASGEEVSTGSEIVGKPINLQFPTKNSYFPGFKGQKSRNFKGGASRWFRQDEAVSY